MCGSRFLTSDYRYPAPISRRTGIHIFAFLLSRIVSSPVSDPTSGFRLYNRRAIELFARDYPHDYPEVEAVLMLHHHRLRMREVPVKMYARGGGRSSISTGKSAYYMLKVLLALLVGLARRRPIVEASDPARCLRGATALMADRIQLVSVLAAGVILLIVLELVRRRRLMERYALLWLLAGVVLLGLAAWRGGLSFISHAIGIYYPPNALFFVAFAFILLLLLHFSSAVSRLSDQTKVLAQRAALLEERLRRLETEGASETANASDEHNGLSDHEQRHEPALAASPTRPLGQRLSEAASVSACALTQGRNRSTQSGPGRCQRRPHDLARAALPCFTRRHRCDLDSDRPQLLGGAGHPAHVRCRLKLIEVEHRLRLHEHRRGSGCERFVGHNRVRVQHEPGVR